MTEIPKEWSEQNELMKKMPFVEAPSVAPASLTIKDISDETLRKSGLGAMMAGGNPVEERQDRDFYPTPVEVTWGLIEHEKFSNPIWEPMCGNWAMAGELEKGGYKVLGTDIKPLDPRGKQADFFSIKPRGIFTSIVTNPPFNLAEEIVEHAMQFQPDKLALVLKATFWHAKSRRALFEKHTPARIYSLTWRPDFLGKGRPTMECIWCVWDRFHSGETVYRLMHKPEKCPAANRVIAAISENKSALT